MYSLAGYGEMLADGVRRRAYEQALEAAIAAGDSVLELGTGPGYFAMVAARLGAAPVVALEPADVIELAARMAERNGLGGRIDFVQQTSTRYRPERRFDILVSDLRGIVPLFGRHLTAIVDARRRLLRPGGTLIPEIDELWAAPVEAAETYSRMLDGWRATELDLELAREAVTNNATKVWLDADACAAPPQRWARIDYREVEDASVEGRIETAMTRARTVHGLALWFDTRLLGEIGFSNRPGAPRTLYRQAFLPFPAPLHLAAGDRLEVALSARLIGQDYVWRWRTRHRPADGAAEERRFDQSSFFAMPLATETLAKRATGYRPEAGEEARILRFVFARMDGEHSNEAIGAALYDAFPERYADARDAFDQVCDLASRYG